MPKPNIAVLGYALFVTINATSLWGGVFPFFPMEFHTPEVTILFFLSQALAYCATFFLTMLVAYRRPEFVHKTLVLIAMALAIAGAISLIAAMYLKWLTIPLVVCGGVCLGIGCGGFAMAWQRYFSAMASTSGIFYLLAGTMLGAPVFFALYLVPSAVTVYLSPVILIPVCGLCAILATRTIDFSLPQFADVPACNPKVYALAVRDYWKSAVGIGAIGFASGAVRAVALADPAAGDATNIFSMIGSLAAAGILLMVWRRRSFQFYLLSALKVLFPASLTCLVLLPLLAGKLSFIAGLLYLAFSVVSLIMLLQCAQASRDRGINPAFIFGFCGGIVYLMQDAGFVFGFWADSFLDGAFVQLAVVALMGGYVLAMAFALQYMGGTVCFRAAAFQIALSLCPMRPRSRMRCLRFRRGMPLKAPCGRLMKSRRRMLHCPMRAFPRRAARGVVRRLRNAIGRSACGIGFPRIACFCRSSSSCLIGKQRWRSLSCAATASQALPKPL